MIVMATGHRDPQGGDTVLAKELTKKWLANNKESIKHVISGAAIGYDTAVGEICIDLDIPFWLYEPYKKHGKGWPFENRRRHAELKTAAAGIVYVCQDFSRRCFLIRDERMVDDADYCLAYLSGEPETNGTAYTVWLASKKGIPVENFYRYV